MESISDVLNRAHSAQVMEMYRLLFMAIIDADGDKHKVEVAVGKFKKGVGYADEALRLAEIALSE